MATKIGLHLQRPTPEAEQAIRAAPWAAVKALDDPAPLATAREAGISCRILRLYGVERLEAPAAADAFLARDLAPATHLQLVCEDGRGGDVAWQRAVAARLREGGYTGKVLGGGFSTGTPARVIEGIHEGPHFPEWPALAQAGLFAAVDGLALDQYVGCPADDPEWERWLPWTGRRHALAARCLVQHGLALPPVLIAESGIDDVIPGLAGGGWRSRGLDPDRYLRALLALDALDKADDALLARCLFTLGATPDWAGYALERLVAPLAEYVRSLPPGPPPPAHQAPARQKGHPGMPAPLLRLPQQPGSKDCWCACIREFFARYGYILPLDAVFSAAKGKPRPDGGEAATFAELKRAITALADQLGLKVQIADFTDPATVLAALHDPDTANPWTIIAGVAEQDLQGPANRYGHFLILDSIDAAGNVTVVDSYAESDGAPAGYPFPLLAQAMRDNWTTPSFDGDLDALGVKVLL